MEKIYDSGKFEKLTQEFWENEKIYKPDNFENGFSIDTPPPTVSGSLHIGHVFSYTQTDIIVRYKRLEGFNVLYPMGFDNNGLPTEKFIEKKCKVSAFKMGRSAFIDLCLEETKKVEKIFEGVFKSLGLSVDWSKCYSTISKDVQKIAQKSFIELFKKNLIYRKEDPALYCPTCRTSVAQAELEDIEAETLFNSIIFTGENGQKYSIATTRPELLSSCVSVFYNPKDSRYKDLKNKKLRVPLYNFEVSVFEDEKVDPEKGTGLVMCCTFGDKTDIEWFKKFNLPYKESIGYDGKMTERSGFLEGEKVVDARKKIIEKLKESGLLESQKQIMHTINVHERCKKEIEFIALNQWFFKILPYKKKFIEIGNQVDWYPKFMKSRYVDWVENINWDWCLSRQRFYGIPFPVWYCQDCKEIILPDIEKLPIDPQESLPDKICKCGSKNFIPDTDVMDTWNTSSLSPYIATNLYGAKPEEFLPMGLRAQAHDIIRTWAFDTIVKCWAHDNKKPWKNITISGHVLTEEGKKISKSQANSPLIPENLLQLYPADAIRYWSASGALGYDTAFSENQLKIGKKLLVKIWNAFKFQESIFEGIFPRLNLDINLAGTANQWILSRISSVFKGYKKSFEDYEFGQALEKIDQFFWHDFCDNYLEIIKDQFFNPEKYSNEEIQETREVLFYLGLRILQLFAPFISHITEVIYQEFYKNSVGIKSIHLTKFNNIQKELFFYESEKIMELVLDIIKKVRKLKSENQISLKTPLEKLVIYAAPKKIDLLKDHLKILATTQAKEIVFEDLKSNASYSLEKFEDKFKATIILEES